MIAISVSRRHISTRSTVLEYEVVARLNTKRTSRNNSQTRVFLLIAKVKTRLTIHTGKNACATFYLLPSVTVAGLGRPFGF